MIVAREFCNTPFFCEKTRLPKEGEHTTVCDLTEPDGAPGLLLTSRSRTSEQTHSAKDHDAEKKRYPE